MDCRDLIELDGRRLFSSFSWLEYLRSAPLPPWSANALETYLGALGIGNLAAAFGSQGPRVLRKKGYIGSRSEFYTYSSYGMLFQLGGWFYAMGWNRATLLLASFETASKIGLYGYSRMLPLKDPRMLVIHGDLGDREVDQLLYSVGFSGCRSRADKCPGLSRACAAAETGDDCHLDASRY